MSQPERRSGGVVRRTRSLPLGPVGASLILSLALAGGPGALGAAQFLRGDANGDARVDLADAGFLAAWLFEQGVPPVCEDAADADDDGKPSPADLTLILAWLGGEVPELPPPGALACGKDPTADRLPCEAAPCPDPLDRDPASKAWRFFTEVEPIAGADAGEPVAMAGKVLLEAFEPARGWSIALRSSCPLRDATTRGTAGADRANDPAGWRQGGFEATRLSVVGDSFLATSAVLLGVAEPIELPPQRGAWPLLGFVVEGVVPDGGCRPCRLEFRDPRLDSRLDPERGAPPIANRIVAREAGPAGLLEVASARPRVESASLSLCCLGPVEPAGEIVERLLAPERRGTCLRFVFKGEPGTYGAVVVELDDDDPADANALWARWGDAAGPLAFDAAGDRRGSPRQRLVLPWRPGELHVTARALRIAGEGNLVRLRASASRVALAGLRPARAARSEPIEAVVTGAGLDLETELRLLEPGGGEGTRGKIARLLSSTLAEVSFAPIDGPLGKWDLVARRGPAGAPGSEDRLAGALEIVEPREGPRLEASIRVAARYRVDRTRPLFVEWQNRGDASMTAPYLELIAPAGTLLRLADDARWHSRLPILAGARGGVAGELAPGSGGELGVLVRSDAIGPVTFELRRLVASAADSGPFDDGPPPGSTAAEWDAVRPRLRADLGSDWPSFASSLAEIATRLAPRGDKVASASELFRFAWREASGAPVAAILGELLDPAGRALAGRELLARQGGETVARARTDRRGRFVLAGLLAGVDAEIRAQGLDLGGPVVPVPKAQGPQGDVTGLTLLGAPAPVSWDPACPACEPPPGPELPPAAEERLWEPVARAESLVVSSIDPNSKDGPVGSGEGGFLVLEEEVAYQVHFENVAPEGTPPELLVPAEEVRVRDELDLDLDADAVAFDAVGFGDTVIFLGEGGDSGDDLFSGYSEVPPAGRLEARAEERISTERGDLIVSVHALFDPATRVIEWTFRSLDPATGLPTTDDEAGFLPVNDETGRGEGFVSFRARVRSEGSREVPCEETEGDDDCDEIRNEAKITFDTNVPIWTPAVVNPIGGPPPDPRRLFVRGDADEDGTINLTDPIVSLNNLFLGGTAPRCLDAADANDDGRFDISDPIRTLGYLFLGEPPPAAPTPTLPRYLPGDCGTDPSDTLGGEDGLDCLSFDGCP